MKWVSDLNHASDKMIIHFRQQFKMGLIRDMFQTHYRWHEKMLLKRKDYFSLLLGYVEAATGGVL